MKKLLFLTAVFLLISFGSVSAFPLFNSGIPGVGGTIFEDDNLDYWVDSDAVGSAGHGIISAGDVLWSAIEFTKIVDPIAPVNPEYVLDRSTDELVALAVIEVVSTAGPWTFTEHMGMDMISVYTGGAIDLDLNAPGPSLAAATAAIVDGTHLWSFSIDADLDTYWEFTPLLAGADDPAAVNLLPGTIKIGVANYQLNQTFGADIFDPILGLTRPGGDGMVDLIGSGDILGGQGLTGEAFARSDVDALVNPIPEPTTMTLFGIGLLSLAGIARRRKE